MSIDWTEIYKNYKGRWVALEDDEQTVVGNGESAREALDAARENGYEQPIVTRMPAVFSTFIGASPRYIHL
jgi:hypothetical protein